MFFLKKIIPLSFGKLLNGMIINNIYYLPIKITLPMVKKSQ